MLGSAWRVLGPVGGFPGLLAGVAGGVVALVAIRRGERALTVFAAVVPLVLAAGFVLAELLVGHE